MWEAALSAAQNIFGCPCVVEVIPRSLAFLVVGVVMGLSLGAIPGLGGLVGSPSCCRSRWISTPSARSR